MKLPRVRITVRWLMIVVVLAAVVLGAFEAGRRWERSDDTSIRVWVDDWGVRMPAPSKPDLALPPAIEPPK